MADKDKETQLSIVIRTVDKATAKIKAINDKLDAAAKPVRDFKEAIAELREKSGFDSVVEGVRGVGGAVMDVLGKVAMIGGVVAGAVGVVMSLIGSFDDLGDTAEALGVGVDFLAQTRYAAEKSGAEVAALDGGLRNLATGLGMARAGSGKLAGFLKVVSPALLRQVKEAKSNEEAFNLLADAAAKLTDKAKLAAFAQKTLGDASLGPLLAKGAKGIDELRKRYGQLAGSQQAAADAAGPVDDAMKDLKATTDGLKAAIVAGLAPALKIIVDRLAEWFVEHRADVERWARQIGEALPKAVDEVVKAVRDAIAWASSFLDSIGGLNTALVAAGAVMVGPLLSAVVTLGAAMLATPFGAWLAGFAAIAALVVGVTMEIKEFKKQLDTSNEVLLQDSNDLASGRITKEEFRKRQPAFSASKDAAMTDDDLLASGKMTPREYETKYPGTNAENLREFLGGAPAGKPAEAHITIDIANAPKGTRVTTAPQGTATVDLSVGYQSAL